MHTQCNLHRSDDALTRNTNSNTQQKRRRQRIPVADEKRKKNTQTIYTRTIQRIREQNAPAILVRQTILNEHERRSNSSNTQMSSEADPNTETKIEEQYTNRTAATTTPAIKSPIYERTERKKTPVACSMHSHENDEERNIYRNILIV